MTDFYFFLLVHIPQAQANKCMKSLFLAKKRKNHYPENLL